MMSDLIRKQIRQGEGVNTEFKSRLGDFESISNTVCAFLNTEGGTVFCGVEDNGKIVGIADADDQARPLHKYLLETISPKALFTVNVDQDGDSKIISIDVPEGKDRPYVTHGSVYIRQKSTTRAADALTLREMVQTKAVTSERWERRPSMAMEDADVDSQEVRETVDEAEGGGRFAFGYDGDDVAILDKLGVHTSRGFTQAGDVLFSRNPALRHPQTRVRVTRFLTDKGGEGFADDQQFEGPLVKVLNQTFDFVSRNVSLRSRFSADELKREDRPEYPLNALREGLVNAFAHRDYSGFSGGVAIGIYPDRIEIWNSGRFPEEVQPGDLSRNHPSIPTNPDIAQVLYLRGLMERIGRGGQLILNACKEYGLRAPKWSDRPSGVTLTFFGSASAEGAMTNLNGRQVALLGTLKTGEVVKPGEYQQRFGQGVTERQARRDLVDLAGAGYLEKGGAGAGTHYVRTPLLWAKNRT